MTQDGSAIRQSPCTTLCMHCLLIETLTSLHVQVHSHCGVLSCAGLRYMVLMLCGTEWEAYASWIGITGAALHFLHSAGLELALCKYGLISSARLQRLTEIAYLGLVLKMLNDASTALHLDFFGTILGKSCCVR